METLTEKAHPLLKTGKRPRSIKEISIMAEPESYESFCYKFTDLKTNKAYIGKHKGYVGDGYLCSPTDVVLEKLISNSRSNLKYEVIAYGSDADMIIFESRLLNEVDAANNENYFNKSNGGISKVKAPRLIEMQKIVDSINNGEFDITFEPTGTIYKLDRLQVRSAESKEHIIKIRNRIDDNGGDTDTEDFNPILIFEERKDDKLDLIGNGSHSLEAAFIAPKNKTVKTMRIPREKHIHLTDQEIIGIGHLLNAPDTQIRLSMSKDDAVKYVVSNYIRSNLQYDSVYNKEYLGACHFSKREITSILNTAKSAIAKNNLALANQVWIDYKLATHNKTMVNTVESYRDKDTMAFSLSSAMFKWDTIFNHIYNEPNTKIDKKTKKRVWNKTKLVVVVYHPEPDKVDKWKTEIQPDVWNKLTFYCEMMGITFEIVEMPTTIQNKI